jgi:hypothetical protein
MIFDAENNTNTTLPNEGNIAIGQGFSIIANEFSSSDFKWMNDFRTGGVDYAFYRKPPVQNAIDIKLGGINNKDLTLIHFGDFNTTDQLPYKNVPKMMNYENSIYTITDKHNNNALNLPFPDQETIIPIGIKIAESGTYYFEDANINLSDEKFSAFLEDKLLKKVVPVNANFNYEFNANKGKIEDRFIIRVINKEAISVVNNINYNSFAYINNEAVVFQMATQDSKMISASIIDATGKNVWTGRINIQNGRGQIDKSQLPQGLLFLKLNDEHSETNFKLANTY